MTVGWFEASHVGRASPWHKVSVHRAVTWIHLRSLASGPQSGLGRVVLVSIASSSGSVPGLLVVTPDEALRQARPLPDVDTMALGDVLDEDWDALLAAIADQ